MEETKQKGNKRGESLKERLAEYQRKYDDLKKQSPDRWWHDEFFDIQLRVLENFIIDLKKKIREEEGK